MSKLMNRFLEQPSSLTEKTTPVDADVFPGGDSAASGAWKKFTWANIKAALSSFSPTVYRLTSNFTTTSRTNYVNITGLSFSAGANKKYHILVKSYASNNNASGSGEIIASLPADAVGTYCLIQKLANVNQEINESFNSAMPTVAYFNANQEAIGIADITIYMSSTAGTVNLQTRATTAGTTTIYAGTEMIVTEIQ